MVTQKDISAALGISISTVSRALSDCSDISDETKMMVRDVAKKMGYRQKAVVERSRKRTCMVGLLATEDAETYFNHLLIMEIRKCLMKKGYDLVLLSPFDKTEAGEADESRDTSRPGPLYRARLLELEGVFLLSRVREADLYHLQDLRSLRSLALGEIPVVTVGNSLSSWGSVLPDYEEGIKQLLRMVYRYGHRRIAVIYGEPVGNLISLENTILRTVQETGLDLHPRSLCRVEPEDAQEAWLATKSILERGKWLTPTCLLFGDDFLMQGGAEAVRQHGLSIPGDISIVSMQYLNYNGHADSALTCWDLNPAEVAREAVEMMLREIEFPGVASRQTRIAAGRLIEGGTLRALKQDII